MGTDWRSIAEHHQIDNRLPVDGEGHGLADALIIEGFSLVVGRHDDLTGGGAGKHFETLVLGHFRSLLGGGDVADHIDVTGLKCSDLGAGITDELESDLVQVRQGRVPVFFVARHFHPIPAGPGYELEGAGAHRLAGGIFIALLGQHNGIAFGHMGDKKGVDIFQGQYQRVVIRCFDFLDTAEKLRVGVLGGLGGVAFQIPSGHSGVERFSVVEGHTLAQTKGVNLAVRGHRPGRRQAGHKRSIAVDLNQTLVDIGKYHPVDGSRCVGGRIKSRRFGRLTDNQLPSLFRSGGKNVVERKY